MQIPCVDVAAGFAQQANTFGVACPGRTIDRRMQASVHDGPSFQQQAHNLVLLEEKADDQCRRVAVHANDWLVLAGW